MTSKGKPVGKSVSASSLSSLSTAKASTLPPSGAKTANKPAAGLTVFKGNEMTAAVSQRKKEEMECAVVEGAEKFIAQSEWEQRDAVTQYLRTTEDIGYLILTRVVKDLGMTSTSGNFILSVMTANVEAGLESGVLLLRALLNSLQRQIEPYALPLIPKLMTLQGDKAAGVRDVSLECCKLLCQILCPEAFRIIYPMLDEAMLNENWKIKVVSLNLLQIISPRMSAQLSPLLPELIPRVSDCMHDSKKQVQTAAIDAMNEACRAISNDDIRPIVPQLVSVIAHPEESIATLNLLLETTFVATVDASVLALIAPLLGKSLRNRSSVMKRKASKVIDIMCRLVQNPSDVAPFKDMLLPALEKVIDELVDAEVCEVAMAAREILLKALGEGKALVEQTPPLYTVTQIQGELLKALEEVLPQGCAVNLPMNLYAAQMCAHLMIYDAPATPLGPDEVLSGTWRDLVANTPKSQWKDCTVPYFNALLCGKKAAGSDAGAVPAPMMETKSSGDGSDVVEEVGKLSLKPRSGSVGEIPSASAASATERAEKLSSLFRTAALGNVKDRQVEQDDDGTNLCNIEFSLAFGGKILLHNTFLKLGKGRRYGVMGKNGAGKTTLLTNIGTGNIEGLPLTMKTVYVQHDDASDDHGVALIDELLAHKDLADVNVTKEEATAALKAINFTDEMLTSPRSCLSGGWKMKLLIIKAMLSKADVLLLDEPTNHLDTASVDWLTNYLLSQQHLTCLIVSHDTGFMDRVLTDVIHYENKKLVYYHGNLTHFVSVHPEAKYYYELEGSTLSFNFPTPGRLDGINSNTRSILKMENVSFTYPGSTVPTLTDVNVKVCLGSRVAVIGANGAGKSTLIRMMVQETKPDEGAGSIWKHINLRVAYVAQHSFHHVEQHLDSSPVDYMKWRFYGGVDREDMARPDKKLTEEEAEQFTGERKYGDVEEVVGRRKFGRTMEYECTFVGQVVGREPNKYIPLEKMIEMGLSKLVQQCDARTAAMAAGLDVRPLLTAEIQGHLNDFNLDAEFGTHGTIKRLSGGQKVKLVLAAAMWNKPHLIVLDEPTNYLDREALGALTQAIKNFNGGVVIISHNKEFTDAICTEQWIVKDGKCYTEGGVEEKEKGDKVKVSKVKKSSSAPNLEESGKEEAGNLNKTISSEIILNPKTLEALSKKQQRLLERCAQVAGVTLKDYVLKITCKSPEWKWL